MPHAEAEGAAQTDHIQRADYSAAAVRTRLSWRRTTLTGTVVALLLLRLAVIHRDRLTVVITALAAFYWLLLLVIAQRRIRAMAEPSADDPAPAPAPLGQEVIQLAAGSLAFAAAGLILALG